MKIKYLNNVPFLCFIALLGVIYISNAHSVEKKLRKIEVLKKEVKEEKWKFMEVKTDIIHESTESQLAKKLNDKEIKINDEAPVKLNGDGE